MFPSKLKIMAALFAGTGLLASSGLFADRVLADKAPPAAKAPKEPKAPALKKAPRASKLDLTPESFPKLQALVKPQDHEWRHLRVHWLTDPVAALKKATAEDKPIVFLYLGGAGYNAPLGVC
jgi:hypothetical protein